MCLRSMPAPGGAGMKFYYHRVGKDFFIAIMLPTGRSKMDMCVKIVVKKIKIIEDALF